MPVKVRVELDANPYDIQIGTDHLDSFGTAVKARLASLTHAVIIVDRSVRAHGQRVIDSLQSHDVRTNCLPVDSGESSKSATMANHLWQQMLDSGADRKTLVVAVGGGVVGDLAGFVAATFARGLAFCQIPTTLLANVDSSVGGKTGINLPGAKNMVGSFWQPCLVFIDTKTLETLPDREYISGMAEVVKYGMIMDAPFFCQLESKVEALNGRDPETLRCIIADCCRLKAQVVRDDERETSGRRAILNYGHTFAHALEAVAGYGELLHGEAVSIGMHCAAHLACQLGRIPSATVQRQAALLTALRLPIRLPDLSHDQLWQAMARDKKVAHGRLRFVLPDQLGNVTLVGDVTQQQVASALAAAVGE